MSARPSTPLRRAIPLPDPPLDDGHLSLRPWRPDDAPVLAAAWADPDVARWTGVPPRADLPAAAAWISGEADRRARGLALDLVVVVDDEVVGEVGLVDDPERDEAEIGWWVAPDHRGRGHATTAARLLATWALDELSVTSVRALCHRANPASARVAEAAGFVPDPSPEHLPELEVWRLA